MELDAIFEDPDRVLFNGPQGGLALSFDLQSFVPVYDPEVWPRAIVAFRTPGLQATMRVCFFPWALSDFAAELASAHHRLDGAATLVSEDGDFRLRVGYEKGGEVTLTGHLQPNLGERSILNDEIATAPSDLNASLAALRALPKQAQRAP